jgi:hypothetical protein
MPNSDEEQALGEMDSEEERMMNDVDYDDC